MIELSEVILRALDEQAGQPLRLVDPRSGIAYLLVRADLLGKTQDDEEEFGGIDIGKLIADAMREDDENDPLLESYQKYRGSDDSAR